MFARLRNKLLLLIMAVTSLVLITAFAVVYAITFNNIHNSNIEKLHASSNNPLFPDFVGISGLLEGFRENLPQHLLPSDYRPSFTLLLDSEGSIAQKFSLLDLPQQVYTEAAQKIWHRPESEVTLRLNGGLWLCSISGEGYYAISTLQGSSSVVGYLATFIDVTESYHTLQELSLTFCAVGIVTLAVVFVISLYFANHAVKPIRTAWEAQKQFIADASHELKTPLTIIQSNYGALISQKKETIESQMKWLDYIREGAERMEKLVADLLCLARAEGIEGSEAVPTNISDIVFGEIEAMASAADDRGLIIARHIETGIIINCEGEKLAQVVRILLDNAIKYGDAGGDIAIALFQERNQTVLQIQNSGDGIAPEHLPKIFDRFYRADTSRTHDGSYGLGLAIAKAIVENMGAKITAHSEVGVATTFRVIWRK